MSGEERIIMDVNWLLDTSDSLDTILQLNTIPEEATSPLNELNISVLCHLSAAFQGRLKDLQMVDQDGEDGSVAVSGCSPSDLRLYTLEYLFQKGQKLYVDELEEVKCIICCSRVEENEPARRLVCMHDFHRHCVDEWLTRNRSCPVCQCPIEGQL